MTIQIALAMLFFQFVHNAPNMPVMTPPTLRYSLQPQLADCNLTAPYKYTATVSMTVKIDGNTDNVHIAKTSGNACVDRQAIAAGTHFRFSPALKESKPVPLTIQLNMNMARER